MFRVIAAGAFVLCVSVLIGCEQQPATEPPGVPAVDDERADNRNAAADAASPTKSKSTHRPSEDKFADFKQATGRASSKNEKTAVKDAAPKGEVSVKDDAALRDAIVGKWHQDKSEKRVITVKADGTATIHAEISDGRQYLVGSKLRFDLEWTIEDGTLTFVTLGGDPPSSIKYINTLYGTTRAYRILEFTSERISLEKADTGEAEPEWTRLDDDADGG